MATSFPNLIDGQAVDSADRTHRHQSLEHSDVVGEFARGTRADLDAAIAAARRAFAKWSRSTPQERFDILDRAGTEILARKDELGRLLVARAGQAAGRRHRRGRARRRDLQVLRRRSAARRRREDRLRPARHRRRSHARAARRRRRDHAVEFSARDSGVEDRAGARLRQHVVFKPAELVPASPWTLVDIVQRAGLPAGVLNLVMGPGSSARRARSPRHRTSTRSASPDRRTSVRRSPRPR